jgi:DNA-binding IclR family transcriptional regulator
MHQGKELMGVSAVERALAILRCFEKEEEWSLSEIVGELGLNKSTVHAILGTLTEHRFLLRDPGTLRYRLGPAPIRLGFLAREQLDIRRVARRHVESLVRETQKSVLLGMFQDDRIVVIDKVDPVGVMHVPATIGQQFPFSTGSFGRVFLAWMAESEIDRLLDRYGLEAYTPATITDPDEYKAELARVREQGFAVDDREEYLLGVRAVSVPLFGVGERVVAALTVVGFTARRDDQPGEVAIKGALRAAAEISRQLGAEL